MKSNAALAQIRKAIKANASNLQASQDRQAQVRWDRIAQGKRVTTKLETR